ncbi:solute carrier family member b3 [Trypanosoma conorhini]|uniref:Solute carrier family member b3 n=1 Tax=Trypanosoma conorhini TaxID=83891 RepID=A0A3R7PM39_9TRYP|nr:solute carrier family member b3 [Trypanosoma conorhini]RNF27428.1 solute carrier family member b3 [Trypanosoma conorhini]
MSAGAGRRGSTKRLLIFSVCVLVFHVLTSLVQEAVFYLPGFHHTLLLTCAQALCVSCFAFVILYCSLPVASGSPWRRIVDARRVPLRTYFMIALANTLSVYLTNEASRLLSFTTQVVFKSGKLLVVWLMRYLAIELPALLRASRTPLKGAEGAVKGQRGRSHTGALSVVESSSGCVSVAIADSMAEGRMPSKVGSSPRRDCGGHVSKCEGAAAAAAAATTAGNKGDDVAVVVHGVAVMDHSQALKEVVSCTTVVVGIAVFTYAAADARTTKNTRTQEGWGPLVSGVTGILFALLCDALMYLGQEKYCFMKYGASHEEVQFHVFLFSSMIGFILLVLSGGFHDAVTFLGMNHMFIALLLACSLLSYSGTFFLLRIVSEFNSSTATLVTSIRKSLTVLCSYIVYPKPFGFLHIVGVSFVMGGIWQYEQARRARSTPVMRAMDDTVIAEEEACV